MSNNIYTPDKWVILKFKSKEETWYKVLGSWYGGYLNGDSWRMSSGLVRIEDKEDHYDMHNHSGSIYRVGKESEGMHLTAHGILLQAEEACKKGDVELSQITVEQFLKETTKTTSIKGSKKTKKAENTPIKGSKKGKKK